MKPATMRFLEVFDSLNLANSDYETAILTRSKISHMRTNRNEVTVDTIVELCRLYPNVNAEYIINDRGPMFYKHSMRNFDLQEVEVSFDMLQKLLENIISQIAKMHNKDK